MKSQIMKKEEEVEKLEEEVVTLRSKIVKLNQNIEETETFEQDKSTKSTGVNQLYKISFIL